jgi:hypothetical protein
MNSIDSIGLALASEAFFSVAALLEEETLFAASRIEDHLSHGVPLLVVLR